MPRDQVFFFTFLLLLITLTQNSSFMLPVVLFIRIVLDRFICSFSILRNSQLESDVCRLPFAVSVTLNLSII